MLSASDRLLMLAPHPDDEVMATGGLLQHASSVGADIRILYLTSGENNPWAQLVFEGHWPLTGRDRARWGERRRGEALEGLCCLKVPRSAARFIGFPDQGLSDLLMRGDDRPRLALANELDSWRPTVVIAPTISDPHPDHSAVALYLEEALARIPAQALPRLRLSFSYAEPSAPASSSLTLEVPADAQERKRRAILCHASQLRWRRAKLLASVGRREVFRRVTEVTDQDPGPPLREVILDPQMLCVRFGPSLGRLFAACVMWIAIQDQVRGPIRLSTRLPLVDDRAPVRDVLRGETVGHATLDRSMLCLEVPLALPMPRSGFVRLDRPLRRRIGFIYGSGWHRVEIACERPPERRLEARPRPRVIESVAHY